MRILRPSVREFIYFRSIAFLFITLPRPRSVSRNLTRVSLPSKRENLRVERRKKKEEGRGRLIVQIDRDRLIGRYRDETFNSSIDGVEGEGGVSGLPAINNESSHRQLSRVFRPPYLLARVA